MAEYQIVSPRWNEDVVTQKRTLFHIPCDPGVELKIGDLLAIRSDEREEIRTVCAAIIEASRVRLVDSLTPIPGPAAAAALGDMARLNLIPDIDQARMADLVPAIDSYRRRWDTVNPDVPWASNPTVWRVVFRYLPEMTPPEYATTV
jgi:hypothetical protein